MTLTRYRDEADVGACVEALRAVYETSGYPTNWPDDPARWLRPTGILRAWVAVTGDIPVAGHVILQQPLPGERSAEVSRLFVAPAARRQGVGSALLETVMRSAAANELGLFLDVTDQLRGARALYQRAGFRLVSTTEADWTTPDGRPVTLHRYAWSRYALGETLLS
jgi:ribosomal protein S18 acetylase RimI-like enzyme